MIRLIISIVGVSLAGTIFFLFTQPRYDQAKQVQKQIDEYNLALDKAAELQKLKDSLISRLNTFREEDVSRLQKLLPDHVDNVRLILDLDNMAGSRAMVLDNVDISGNSSAKPGAIVALGGDSIKKYGSLTLRFGATGAYTDFLGFLGDLEASLRVVDLVALSMAPTGGIVIRDSSKPAEPLYHFSLELKTYWLK